MRVLVWGRRRSHLEGCDGQALEREVLGVYGAVLERGGGRNDQHILMPHAEAAVLVVPGLVRQRHPRTKSDLVRRLPIPCAADAADACVCACVRMRVCAWARMQVRVCACARARVSVCVRCSDRPQPSWACACVQERLSARRPCGARRRDDGTRRRRHARCFRWQCGARPSQAEPSQARRRRRCCSAVVTHQPQQAHPVRALVHVQKRADAVPRPCGQHGPAASACGPVRPSPPRRRSVGRPVAVPPRSPRGPQRGAARGLFCLRRAGWGLGRAFGCGPQRTYRAGSRARPATAACARRRRAGSPSCPRGRPPCRRRCARAARASSTAAPATPASHARRQRAPSRRQAPLWMRPRSARRRAPLPFPLLRPAPARPHIYLYEYIYIHPLQGCGLPARWGRGGGPILPIHRTGCGGADTHVLRRLAEVHRARDVGRAVDVLRARVDEVPVGRTAASRRRWAGRPPASSHSHYSTDRCAAP